ncbi:sigma-54-dependent Fis family transcriptional regulator [Geotalea uraniireducens]|uniref:Sigma-54-dependent Fis family transcriptional regulator n=1 Tax=Geotalea uraniireducens TaxID=351604 RepID=A0ABN6VYH8_9BACT|nr:sigma-54 dependent transcriptional regulator [Geotalea uraniireducens]BDV44572.1 sigma-54-dependent Fis family transcriptional regulator [Geotalea uraniireducens]
MNEELYPAAPILLVDDELPWLRSLSLTLREATGVNNIIKCSDSREVLGILQRTEVSLILLDLTMPHFSGQDLLPMITRDYPDTPVIVLSGLNQVDTAVRCMQLGAVDYYVKTVERERLVTGIQRAFSMKELRDENQRLKARFLEDHLEFPDAFYKIKSRSQKMRAVLQYCEAVAQSSEPILITGESGVGKELIARAIRCIRCPDGPWVAVNVAGLDDNVFSDTLFGHTRGAFTGADRERRGMIEEAAGGTLFLDEIGDLSHASQVKLLRLLQEGEFFPLGADQPRRLKAKLLFATNHELAAKKESGAFRKDLYYRLSAHQVRIPPLRERFEDLPLLIDHFLQEAADSFGKKKPTAPKELATLLSTYAFPGNVRELRAMIYNAVSLHKSHVLSLDSFKAAIGYCGDDGPGPSPVVAEPAATGEPPARLTFPQRLPRLEETANLVVKEALRRSRGNQTLAATMLGITRQALAKRLKKIVSDA